MNARQLEPPLVRRPSIRAAPRRLITPHERKSAPNWACRYFSCYLTLVMIESENHVIVKPRLCCLRVV
jgi:hypothetical protein